jgi:hypothetical protein
VARGLAKGARGLSGTPASAFDAHRVKAWTVLANLLFDTWFDGEQYARFARDLIETAFSPEELEIMLRDEVAPVFGANLLSVAGEWVLWDETEVRDLKAAAVRADGTMPLRKRILGRLTYRLAWVDWLRLKSALAAERTSQPTGRN